MKKFSLILILLLIPILKSKAQSLESQLLPWIDIVVAADGSGRVLTVQEAIDMIPDNNSERKLIYIRNGIYKEKIMLGKTKTNITMIGQDVDSVILTYDDYSGRVVGVDTIGTSTSYSFAAEADDFIAMNITFENSAGPVGQAVALRTSGDRQVFFHCKLIGHQDTYYTIGHYRNYLVDCFIEGTTDYIFGRTTTLFDSCHINSLKTGSYITAASTEQSVKYGYVFRNCHFTASQGIERVFLGRPWRPYAQTVILESYLENFVNPEGWSIWRGNENHLSCYYAEFNNHGPGANTENRAEWAHQLSGTEASQYTPEIIFSRSTNHQYFISDWVPSMDENPLYKIVKKETKRFIE
jgi:pectinesterase